jgi:hypothetical protein
VQLLTPRAVNAEMAACITICNIFSQLILLVVLVSLIFILLKFIIHNS